MQNAAKLVWLASYPKSGNTWVRFLLSNIFWGPIRDSASIDRHIPDIHTFTHNQFPLVSASTHEGFAFAKTHQPVPTKLPYKEITSGVIYIVRNPLDMASSLLHYAVIPDHLKAGFIEQVIQYEQSRLWKSFGGGAWPDHVRRWALDDTDTPRLVLFYENMVDNPVRELSRILAFLGVSRTELTVEEAVQRSSFSSLKAIEEGEIDARKDGFFSKEMATASHAYHSEARRFMRQGKVGSHRADFSADQIERAIRRFSPLWDELLQNHNEGRSIPLA